MLTRAILTLALTAATSASPATAQTLDPIVKICTDPLTTGPQKLDSLPDLGWIKTVPSDENLLNLVTAHMMGFNFGMPSLDAHYSRAPMLVQELKDMMTQGSATLWTSGDAVLAITIDKVAKGGEHLTCYFASPPHEQTLQHINRLEGAETLPHLELIARRFDETVATVNPEKEYKMYGLWARITSDPARGPLTDSYRLVRVEQIPAN